MLIPQFFDAWTTKKKQKQDAEICYPKKHTEAVHIWGWGTTIQSKTSAYTTLEATMLVIVRVVFHSVREYLRRKKKKKE